MAVTDDEIRALLDEARRNSDEALRRDPVDVATITTWGPIAAACETALGVRQSKRPGGKARARARCAEILSTREMK